MSESPITIDSTDVAAVSMDGVGIISGGRYVVANDALARVYECRAWDPLYTLTQRGRRELEARRDWEARHLGEKILV